MGGLHLEGTQLKQYETAIHAHNQAMLVKQSLSAQCELLKIDMRSAKQQTKIQYYRQMLLRRKHPEMRTLGKRQSVCLPTSPEPETQQLRPSLSKRARLFMMQVGVIIEMILPGSELMGDLVLPMVA